MEIFSASAKPAHSSPCSSIVIVAVVARCCGTAAKVVAAVSSSEEQEHHDDEHSSSSSTQELLAAPRDMEQQEEEDRVIREEYEEELRVAKEEARVAQEEARVAIRVAQERIRVAQEEARVAIRVAEEEARAEEEVVQNNYLGPLVKRDKLPYLSHRTAPISPYARTGRQKSKTTMQSIDNWISPQWDQLGRLVPYSTIPTNDIVFRMSNLLCAVLLALGLERHLEIHHKVPIMGMEQDIVIYWKFNKMAIGCFEIRSPQEKLREHVHTPLTELVFDLMHTYRLGGPDQVFSVLTTFNEWQLHSTHSLDSPLVKDVLENWQTKLQDYSEGTGIEPSSDLAQEKGEVGDRNPKEKMQRSDQKEQIETGKRGRRVRETDLPRKHFVSDVVSLRKHEDRGSDSTNCSKSVVDLIATALLLMLESTKTWSKPRMTDKPLTGPVRHLALGRKQAFSFKTVTMPNGINLNSPFENNQPKLYVWYPLGKGSFATCYLASSTDGSGKTCVVKVYHPNTRGLDTKELADTEAENWNTIAGKQVARSYPIPVSGVVKGLLVMPYVHPIPVPERESLVSEGPTGMLWQAFHRMAASKRFYHECDIRWCHVGYLSSAKNEICLCDLGHLRSVKKEDADGCVAEALEILKKLCQT